MASNITKEAIASRIRAMIQEHIGTDEPLTLETHLQDDLAVDSLERVELGIKVEKTFGITLENSWLRTVVTVGDFIQLVEQQVALQTGEVNRI